MRQNEIKRNKKEKVIGSTSGKTQRNKSTVSKRADGKIKRHYLKSKSLSKVTFKLPKEAVEGAESVTIVGDFNKWNVTQTPMKKLKNGSFTLTLELPCNREFNFRYLVDANRWENDWFADKYVPNDFEEDNAVTVL